MPRTSRFTECVLALFFSVECLHAVDVLESVATARSLPYAATAEGHPVSLTGVVTYVRDIPQDFNFSLHDATGGVMVYPMDRKPLKPGQRVTVTGMTAVSVHGLRIAKASIGPGEMATLPEPVGTTMAEVLDGLHEGMFAEMEGVIRGARLESPEIQPRRLALDFGNRGRRLSVWVSQYAGSESRFVPGAKVRVRGVVVRWKNPRGQTHGINVLVNSVADITDLAPPVAPPVQSIADVQFWSAADEPATRLTTRGVVTFHRPGEVLVLQDGDRAIRIRPAEPGAFGSDGSQGPMPGERWEVVGFPVLGEYTVELEDARLMKLEAAALPPAESYQTAADVLKSTGLVDRDSRRISVTGTLRAVRERDDRRALEMESGGVAYTAWLPLNTPLPNAVSLGAELRLDGICTLHLSPTRRRLGRSPDQFSLQLPDVSGIHVTKSAPWWTTQRLLASLGAVGGLTVLMAAWTATLRNRNRRLSEEINARQRAERELASERHRVAAELHDTLEQTLVAAGLQLNAASRTLTAKPESAAAQVSLAHQLVARSRQEVRDAVWDLRLDSTQPSSLATMLEQACTESSACAATEIIFVHDGTEPAMPTLVIAQAIRIVRECIANALKHASPKTIRVTQKNIERELQLKIADDGCGFDSAAAPGPETGHFGLSGMRERVERLGGELTLETSKGAGTTITVRISLP